MTPDDARRFSAALAGAAETLGEPMSATRIEGYFVALRDLPIDAVERALAQAMREWRAGGGRPNFPRPADLRDLVTGTPDDRAALAWSRLLGAIEIHGSYVSVDFRDPAMHAAIEAMGGWAEMWRLEPARLAHEGRDRDLGYKRHEFCQLYLACLHRPPDRIPRYLVGIAEAANRAGLGGPMARGLGHVDEVLTLGPGNEVLARTPVALPVAQMRALPAVGRIGAADGAPA